MFLILLVPIICIVPARGVVFSFIPGGDAIKNVVTPFLNSFNTTDANGVPTYAANIVRVIDPILAMNFNQDDVVSSPDDYRQYHYPDRNLYESGYFDNNRLLPPRYSANDIFIPRNYPSNDYFYQPYDKLPEREHSPWNHVYGSRFNPSYQSNFPQELPLETRPSISAINGDKVLKSAPISFDWAPRPTIPVANINYGIVEPNFGNYPVYSFDNKNKVQNFNQQTNPTFNSIEQSSFPPKTSPVSPYPSNKPIVSPFLPKNVPLPLFRPSDLFKPYSEDRIKYLKNLMENPSLPAPVETVPESDFDSNGIRTQWPRDPKDPQASYALHESMDLPDKPEKINVPSSQQNIQDFNKAKALIMIPLSYRSLYQNEPSPKAFNSQKNAIFIPLNQAKESTQNDETISDIPSEQQSGKNFDVPKIVVNFPSSDSFQNADKSTVKTLASSNYFNFLPSQQVIKSRLGDERKLDSIQLQGKADTFNGARPIVMLTPDGTFLKTLAPSNSFDSSPMEHAKFEQDNLKTFDSTPSQASDQKSDKTKPVVMLSPDGSQKTQLLDSENKNGARPIIMLSPDEPFLKTLATSNSFDFSPMQQTKLDEENLKNSDSNPTQSDDQESGKGTPVVMLSPDGSLLKKLASTNQFNFYPLKQTKKINSNDQEKNYAPVTQQSSQKPDEARPIVVLSPSGRSYSSQPSQQVVKSAQNDWQNLNSPPTLQDGRRSNEAGQIVLLMQGSQPRHLDGPLFRAPLSTNYLNFNPSREAQKLSMGDNWSEGLLTQRNGRESDARRPSVMLNPDEPILNALAASNYFNFLNSQQARNSDLDDRNFNLNLNQQRGRESDRTKQTVLSWPSLRSQNQNEPLMEAPASKNYFNFFPEQQPRIAGLDDLRKSSSFLTQERSQKSEEGTPIILVTPDTSPAAKGTYRDWLNSLIARQIANWDNRQDTDLPLTQRMGQKPNNKSPTLMLSPRFQTQNSYAPLLKNPVSTNDFNYFPVQQSRHLASNDWWKFDAPLTQHSSPKFEEAKPIVMLTPSLRSTDAVEPLLRPLASSSYYPLPLQQTRQFDQETLEKLNYPQMRDQKLDDSRPIVVSAPINHPLDADERLLKAITPSKYFVPTSQHANILGQNYIDTRDFPLTAKSDQTFNKAKPVVMLAPSPNPTNSYEPLMKALASSKYAPSASQTQGQNYVDSLNLPQNYQDFDNEKPIVMSLPSSHVVDSNGALLKTISSPNYFHSPSQKLGPDDLSKSNFLPLPQLDDQELESNPTIMVPIPAPLSPEDSILNTYTSTKNYNLLPIQLPESFLNNLIASGLFSMLFNDLPGGGGAGGAGGSGNDVSRAALPEFTASPRRSYTLLSPKKHNLQLYDPTLRGYHGGINPFAHHHVGHGYVRHQFR